MYLMVFETTKLMNIKNKKCIKSNLFNSYLRYTLHYQNNYTDSLDLSQYTFQLNFTE